MTLMEELKKRSSKWIKTQGKRYAAFYWQNGYGIFSVNPLQIDVGVKYILDQEQHHKKMSFKEEYIGLLERYSIEYDERYVWD